jgi:30S ribosomal protein S31
MLAIDIPRGAKVAADILPAPSVTTTGAAMGKGDLRTRRGKIYNGSFGKRRPGRPPAKAAPQPVRAGSSAPRK